MRGQHIAVFFPGQGVLDTAASATYRQVCPELPSMLAEVDDVARQFWAAPSSWTLSRRSHRDGTLDLAIFVASIAAFKRLQQQGVRPHVLVGHGFGEIGALVAAEALSVRDGATIVARRFLALAARKTANVMASVRISPAKMATFLRILNERAVSVVAENSSTESVIVGPAAGISAAGELARMLCIPFRRLKTMSGPHQASMNGIQEELVRALGHVRPRPPKIPVFSPLRARCYDDGDDVVHCLAEQLVQPLRFADAVRRLTAEGITLFIECGPLRGLAAQLDCIAVADTSFHEALLGTAEDDPAARAAGEETACELDVA